MHSIGVWSKLKVNVFFRPWWRPTVHHIQVWEKKLHWVWPVFNLRPLAQRPSTLFLILQVFIVTYILKVAVSRDVALCSLVNNDLYITGAYCFHRQCIILFVANLWFCSFLVWSCVQPCHLSNNWIGCSQCWRAIRSVLLWCT